DSDRERDQAESEGITPASRTRTTPDTLICSKRSTHREPLRLQRQANSRNRTGEGSQRFQVERRKGGIVTALSGKTSILLAAPGFLNTEKHRNLLPVGIRPGRRVFP